MSVSAWPDPIEAYDVFASVYARHFGDDAVRTLPIHQQLVLRHLLPGAHILDVCCGTGQLARELTARGFHVTGIDASPRMLEHAQQLAPSAFFLCADVLTFHSELRFAAALSTFNSFAHLQSAADLQRAFANINDALSPGASLCFDLYMEEAYLRRWKGSFDVVLEGQRCTVTPAYDALRRMATNHIQIFDSTSGRLLREVTITQHCFPQSTVLRALVSCGFAGVIARDATQFDLPDEAGRTFFLGRKN